MESPSSFDLSDENILGTLWAQLLLQFSTDFWKFSDVFCMEWRCACALDIILWLFFSRFFCFVNLVFFQYEMLSKCIDSGYFVGATPLTVFHQLFWNIADVFSMEWRCACGFDIILWLFFSLFLLCESLFLYNPGIFFFLLSFQFSVTDLSFSSDSAVVGL